jgi:uncharacterized protein
MARLTALSLQHRTVVLVAAVVVSALAAVGALKLRSETGYRAALGGAHPSVVRLDAFIADFGGGLPVQVAWECPPAEACRHALEAPFLLAAERIALAVGAAPGVRDVHTPANTPILVAEAGAIDARYLLDGDEPAPDLHALAEAARKDPLWRGALVSEDGRTAALVVEIESSDPGLYHAAVRSILAAVEAEAPRRYALVGDPVDFVAGGGQLNEEAKRLAVVAVLLVAAVIWILFRRPSVVLPSLATVGIAALWTLGLMGWMRWPETEISQALVPLLLVVGICDAIHFLSRYRDLPGEVPEIAHLGRRERLVRAARDVGWPCLVTSATTAAGLASFATSDLVAFVNFGLAAAAGVLFALLVTFTVLPILVDLLRIEIPRAASSAGWVRALDIMTASVERHALAIVAGSVLLLAAAVWGIGQLRVDVTKESLLGSTSPIVEWQRWVAERMRRPDTLEVRLSLPEDLLVSEPASISFVEQLARFLEAQSRLGPVRSIVDPLGRMNELLHDGDPVMRRPGSTRQENEQLLFALSSYDRSFLASWVTLDRREVRLSVEADLLSKEERSELLATVSFFLDRELPAGWSYELTGPLTLFAEMVAAIHSTQLRSFAAAALVIALLVALCLRSFTAAAWVLIPTALPVAVTLGAMGLLDVPLDTGTAMIAAIVLGIAVDDSVHLVTRYKGHRFAGRERSDAMRRSMREVGRALVASSLALAAGFLAMLLSSWGAIASFGLLSACAILLALAADLFLLPAIVFLVAGRSSERGEEVREAGRAGGDARMRAVLLLLGGVAIAALLGKTGHDVLGSDATTRPACRPLENGVVALSSALVPGCPLRPFELARAVAETEAHGEAAAAAAFSVQRQGSEVRVFVPHVADPPEVRIEAVALVAAVSAFFLLVCFATLWRSPAPAALPLATASTATVAVAVAVALGAWSTTATRAGTVGLAVLPSALFHLALTFPAERPLLRATPRFLRAIYVPGAVAALVALTTYFRLPELFRVVSQLLLVLAVLGGAAVLVSSVSVLRHSQSALHRARARILLWTLAGVAAGGAVLLWASPTLVHRIPGGRPGALSLAMLGTLLPLAYTVHRYHLADLPAKATSALRVGARGVSFVAFIIVWNALLPPALDGAMRVGVAAGLAWLTAEILNAVLWDSARLSQTRRTEQMSALGVSHASRIHALSARAELARELRRTVEAAVRPRFATVFFLGPSGWFPADASGSGPTEERMAALASRIAVSARTVYLAEEGEGRAPGAEELREAGVETVIPLGEPGARRGIAILGSAPEALCARDREFLDTLAAHTVTGLAWLEAAEQIAHASAVARGGFLAASLTHDLGKPINNIWSVARSALKPGRTADEVRARLAEIQGFADHALAIVDRLFLRAQASASGARSTPLGEVVTLTCQEAERMQGRPIVISFQGVIPDVECDFEVSQALAELLANACRESPEGAPVEVAVTASAQGRIWIEVADSGPGMDEETRVRAFEPWFTRRAEHGGRGLGLPLSQLLIRQVGGEVEIVSSEPGKGTRMRILLPRSVAAEDRP